MGHVVNPVLYRLKYILPLNLSSVTKNKYSDFFDLKIYLINNFVNSYFFNYNKSIYKRTIFLILSLKLSFKYNNFILYLNLKQTKYLKRKIKFKLRLFKKIHRKRIKINLVRKSLNMLNLNLKFYSYWFAARSKNFFVKKAIKSVYIKRYRLTGIRFFKDRLKKIRYITRRGLFKKKSSFAKIKRIRISYKKKKRERNAKNNKLRILNIKNLSFNNTVDFDKLSSLFKQLKYKNSNLSIKPSDIFEIKLSKAQVALNLIKLMGKKYNRVKHLQKGSSNVFFKMSTLKFKLLNKNPLLANYLFLNNEKVFNYNLKFISKKTFKFSKKYNYINKNYYTNDKTKKDPFYFKRSLLNKIKNLSDIDFVSQASKYLKKKLILMIKKPIRFSLSYRDARRLNMRVSNLKNKRWDRLSKKFLRKNVFKSVTLGGRKQSVGLYQSYINKFWLNKFKNNINIKNKNIQDIFLKKKIFSINKYSVFLKNKNVKNLIIDKFIKKYAYNLKKNINFKGYGIYSSSKFKSVAKKSIKWRKSLKVYMYLFKTLSRIKRNYFISNIRKFNKLINLKYSSSKNLRKKWRSKFRKKVYPHNTKLKHKLYFFHKFFKKKYRNKRYINSKHYKILRGRRSHFMYKFFKENYNIKNINFFFKNYYSSMYKSSKFSYTDKFNRDHKSKWLWELGFEAKKFEYKNYKKLVFRNIRSSTTNFRSKRFHFFLNSFKTHKKSSDNDTKNLKFKRFKYIKNKLSKLVKKYNNLKTKKINNIVLPRPVNVSLKNRYNRYPISLRKLRGKFIISNYFKFKNVIRYRSSQKLALNIRSFLLALRRSSKRKLKARRKRLKLKLSDLKNNDSSYIKKRDLYAEGPSVIKNIPLKISLKFKKKKSLVSNRINYFKYLRNKKSAYYKKNLKRRLKKKLLKKNLNTPVKILKNIKKVKNNKLFVFKKKLYEYNFLNAKKGKFINKNLRIRSLYSVKLNKKIFKFRRRKKYFFLNNVLLKYFFNVKIFLFKNIFVKAISKFLSYKSFVKIFFIIKKIWSSIKSADMFAEAMIIRLLKKNSIRSIIRSIVFYFKKYLRKKYIGGYSILFAGRFTRKDRAMHLWHRGGLYSRSNRVVSIDYSNRRVALKYSSCSFKISLIKSVFKKKC